MPDQHSISSETEAIARAARLTGLDALTKKITASRVVVEDERTPYLWEQYTGQHAWRVEFADVFLHFKSAVPDFADRYKRKFSVLLDEHTGQLISIVCRFEGQDPDLHEQPSGASAERQLKAEDEFYYGLPTEQPKLTFLAALEIVLNKGIGSPFLAKEIYANYVIQSRGEAPRRNVWVVTLRGLPPIPSHGPRGVSSPAWHRNYMRNVVDDETGVNLFATNVPHPD